MKMQAMKIIYQNLMAITTEGVGWAVQGKIAAWFRGDLEYQGPFRLVSV